MPVYRLPPILPRPRKYLARTKEPDVPLSAPEFPVIDEAYDYEYDYNGYVTWQTPADFVPPEDFQIPAEATQIDQTYDVEHTYDGFVSWQMPEDAIAPEDFQALAESTVIDDTYSVRYSYKGWTQAPLNPDYLMGSQPPLVVDDAYDVPGYNYDGWQHAPMREGVEPPIPAVYPVIDELYDLFYGHSFDGLATFPTGNRSDVLIELPTYLVRVIVPSGGDVLLKATTGKAKLIKNPSADVKVQDTLYGPS